MLQYLHQFALAFTCVICLLTTGEASAIYDPGTGRFLQRDPSGTPGFNAPRLGGGVAPTSEAFIERDASRMYPDGMNLYAAYHVLRGGLDPSGLAVYPEEGIPLEPLPLPTDKEGWAFPGMNFAGGGWRFTAKTRPVSTWDLISKIHDFSYEVNRITFASGRFGLGGDGDANSSENRISRQAKADYIFREMSGATSDERSLGEDLLDLGARAVFRGANRSSFKKCDYFYNILEDAALDEPTYLMIPWDALPDDQKDFLKNKHRNTTGSWLDRQLNPYNDRGRYTEAVGADRTMKWRTFLKQKMGAGLWSELVEIDDMTGSE